jgi:hypothetical protein
MGSQPRVRRAYSSESGKTRLSILKEAIRFDALAYIVGWVKRDVGTIYVGFVYLNAPQKFETATKLANPTRLVVTGGSTQPTN